MSYLLVLGLVIAHSEHFFFWDTIQFAGRHGLWFYDNGFGGFFLPEHMDSGHPPFFGMYLAMCWMIWDKTLLVSHLCMLPFLGIIYYSLRRIGKGLLGQRYALLLWAWTLCPFFLGHLTLISPDIVLLAGFSLVLCGQLQDDDRAILLGSILLGMISMRGFVVLVVCALVALWRSYRRNMGLSIFTILRGYGIGVAIFLVYQMAHYHHTQWVGFHDDSPWAESFGLVDIPGLAKNSVVYIWRLMDHAMVIAWLIILWGHARTKVYPYKGLLGILIIIFFLLLTPFDGLMNHRYLLPIQLLVVIWACYILKDSSLIVKCLLVLTMALGNLIIYPDNIAQGWDSTAAHFPIYALEKQLDQWREAQGIPREEIGTGFPMRGPRRHLDPEMMHEVGYAPYDITEDRYILYSNILNDLSDSDLHLLEQWTILWHGEMRGVHLSLLQRRDQ